ncbi:MAG: methylenetetrahydrofolate reductase [NAD(P)H] [Bacteroidales bacterium]|jgi:methylenetetrahydrofolate reductase (NADPH)|nr:methylenetetrahydrofolate reductase [NAD(P)H] [Bacteroidales bacterium]NLK79420.1 methylenetetrahydrofolate reductase [NAD(P)H] [Bacteroidales bacterium]HKM30642.1 methylenetetrahydrofolate reductase [NAD(P)H] [Bacteroidales bacterium]HPX78686.1 methylenetetrahydrofolate reductase [NAD(P)H] [Bacteroidales bacterium]HQB23298.1 methylenetetrahydrofolate reductase [NAD(P)H] [Bacteroidales bacterium]
MKLTDIFNIAEKTFSFEFFPPRDQIAALDLGINIGHLLRLRPAFVSVTYGAGGSTQSRTFELVDYLKNKVGLNTVAHYTCVGSDRKKTLEDLQALRRMGLQNFMLLRGDPKAGSEQGYVPLKDGFANATELIAFARKHIKNCCIGGGAYPEVHPESLNAETDLQHLKMKVDAGCDFLITQFFFDNRRYFDFVARARKEGILCRIIPGVIPLTKYDQLERFVKLSRAAVPPAFLDQLESNKDNPDAIYNIGMDFAIRQCRDLLMLGAPGIHFYTLNKSRATVEIYQTLMVR